MFSSNTSQVSSGGYEIQRSLRFNSADSAYLNRTPASAGNRKTWTYSTWVKRSVLGAYQCVLGYVSSGGSVQHVLQFTDTDELVIYIYTSGYVMLLKTSQVFRDVSAWYHIVIAQDTTQATDINRVKMYINGVQVTSFSTASYPAQNTDGYINSNVDQGIGSYPPTLGAYFNGYITETYMVDGQALTPSSFGAFDAQTGVWGPTPYAGSYGTNGFYLNFSDNSNTTAATLGKDYSGNGNNWTPNNFSVSAGAGNDSLVDVPTNWGVDTGVGGSVRGNYCTLNPLSNIGGTYSQGNLRYVGPSSWRRSNATISRSDGKWYWEVTLGNAPFSRSSNSEWNAFGFGVATAFNSTTAAASITDAVVLADSGYFKNFSGSWTDGGVAFASGDVLSIAVDLDANTFTFRRNNTQITTGTIGGTAGRELVPIIISYDGNYGVMDCNFGQRPFAYTAPSGFKALNTQNLPTPTIGATSTTLATKYFNPVLYTGTGASLSVTGVGFQPDLVWGKSRSAATNNNLYDAVRGTGKILVSNNTDAEVDVGSLGLSAFNSDGFSLGAGSTLNNSGSTYVAWNWKANGAGVTNTAGSITSTVSANTTSGFSVVTYTGNGAAGPSVGHGLSAVPKMIILKQRTAQTNYNWFVYHQALGNTQYLLLNSTNSSSSGVSAWNNTTPTSSVFTIGSYDEVNRSGSTFVAYCFAEVPGYSKFGSYTGNGSSDGPFVFCGFRPAFVLLKMSSATSDWWLYDTKRGSTNVIDDPLYPNGSYAEDPTPSLDFDILSNGFKLRSSNGTFNGSGNTYIFAAFAEAPQKFALAR